MTARERARERASDSATPAGTSASRKTRVTKLTKRPEPTLLMRAYPQDVGREKFGPAMQALDPKWRAFVAAYVSMSPPNAAEAARMAGYSDAAEGAKVRAHRILSNPSVMLALREAVIARISANLPVYVGALEEVALDRDHRDRVKALGMLISRGGLPDITQKDINVNVTVTSEQKVAEIRQMAEELGLDPKSLLGNVTDAEFADVTDAEPTE